MSDYSILFFGKEGDPFVRQALQQVESRGVRVQSYIGNRHQPFPTIEETQGIDLIISYLSPWIIPKSILDRATVAGINFHPAPPEYPGIGCTNFALYNGVTEYGVTCHHMDSKVDTGSIIAVRRFAIDSEDSVYAVTQQCYRVLNQLFVDIVPDILDGKPFPHSPEHWTRRPYTREELNALCVITPQMDPEEVRRRVRATTYPGMPGAYIVLGGIKFLAESIV